MGQNLSRTVPPANDPPNVVEQPTPLHPPECQQSEEDLAEMRRRIRENPLIVQREQEDTRFFIQFLTSPLNDAIRRSHKSCMALLLQHNANVNCRDSVGETPLYLAITASEFHDRTGSMVKLLLEKNASPNYNFSNYARTYYLCSAVIRHCNAVVKLLLEYGADTEDGGRDVISIIDVCYPILHSLYHNNSIAFYLLLLHGAQIQIAECCTTILITHRILACYNTSVDALKMLELYRQFGGNLWEKLDRHHAKTGLQELIDMSSDYMYDEENRTQLITKLSKMMGTPLTLGSLCRNAIRKSLGRRYWVLVYQLKMEGVILPWTILQFLLYRELAVGLPEADRAWR